MTEREITPIYMHGGSATFLNAGPTITDWGTASVPSESDELHFPKPSLLEPSYVMDDGADEAMLAFARGFAKVLGVIAWAAGWWIVARLM